MRSVYEVCIMCGIALWVVSDVVMWLHACSDVCSAVGERPQDFSLRSAPLSSDWGRDLDV